MKAVKTMRTFLAVEPPGEIKNRIELLQGKLKNLYPEGIRWVNRDGIHLTLKFFGNVEEKKIALIRDIIEREVTDSEEFWFTVENLGFFPSPKHPRVIWLGLGGDIRSLSELNKRLEQNFVASGFREEEHPFTPHLTLGRIKGNINMENWRSSVSEEEITEIGAFYVYELILFKSELTPQGARYTKLASFPLGKK